MVAKFLVMAGCVVALVAASGQAAHAQLNPGPVFGTCSACGSGGTPSGPTNPGMLGVGTSTGAGSGGIATGPLNPNAYGFGRSTAGGSGGVATGPTVPGLNIMADPYNPRAAYAIKGKRTKAARKTGRKSRRVVQY
jgi:hypothetical protein